MMVLLIAGIAFVFAGVIAVGFGIPVNEFSFGNTLILAGVISACTGAVLLALSMLVRELRAIRLGLDPAVQTLAKRNFARSSLTSGPDLLASGEGTREAASPVAPIPADASISDAPWQTEAAARDRNFPREDGSPSIDIPPPVEEPPPKRRNLLFSSTSRKERERALVKAAEGTAVNPESAAADRSSVSDDLIPTRATFEESWPQERRAQTESSARRSTRAPSTFAAPNSADASHQDGLASVTVLKSGVVDGMAYSLYSDGSIEAQMPEGMMRFASIDELRAHLDHRP